jgi:multicomponent Na+:H+ antiporter subunit E
MLFLLWIAANGASDPIGLLAGLLVTLCIAVAVSRMSPIWSDLRTTPSRLFALMGYIWVFLRELVKSNLNVLRLVYAPSLRLRPGIVSVTTDLSSPLARFVLSNTITLTPGSLVLGMEGRTIYVHGLDLASTDIDANTEAFVGAFDPILARGLG